MVKIFHWDDREVTKNKRAIIVVPFVGSKLRTGSIKSFSVNQSLDLFLDISENSSGKYMSNSDGFCSYRLQEASNLASALSLDLVKTIPVSLKKITSATFLGKGKINEIGEIISSDKIVLVIIDHSLTPVQQRNLEKIFKARVLDRVGLILEIFNERARTKEGCLQVELARLNYQKSRLVRSWTHLERQRGGLGFVGGPGETQIESDRRIIRQRISRLKKDLEKVRKTRTLHRANRKKMSVPTVALVGYTNSGKSTLFNFITGANVYTQDQLFATLDPTLRKICLSNTRSAILSDTVGFISELPSGLVAAFQATLEEVIEADLIVHVRDISHPMTFKQRDEVFCVLEKLGINPHNDVHILEVWNKIDLLEDENIKKYKAYADCKKESYIPISAIKGDGIDDLLKEIDRCLC